MSLVNLKSVVHSACPELIYNASCPAPGNLSGSQNCADVLAEVNGTCRMIDTFGGDSKSDPVISTEKVEITLLPLIGDSLNIYTAAISDKYYRHDQFKLEVNESGLLQSADLTSEDKTGVAVTGLIKTALYASNLPSTSGLTLNNDLFRQLRELVTKKSFPEKLADLKPISRATCELNPNSVEPYPGTEQKQTGIDELILLFDPLDESSVKALNTDICHAKFNSRISAELLNPATNIAKNPLTLPNGTDSFKGLVYRRVRPVEISILRPVGATSTRVRASSIVADLPNGAPADGVSVESAPLVNLQNNLKFVDGMLVSIDYDKPSQLAAGIDVALSIVELPFELVGKLLTLNVNQTSSESGLTELEKKQLELENPRFEQMKSNTVSDVDQQISDTSKAIELAKKQQELELLSLQKEKNELETQKQIEVLKNAILLLEE